jgi:N-glycosylase/DNA lyase
MPKLPQWSDWNSVGLENQFNADSLRETLDGGQSFRWNWQESAGTWFGVFGNHAVQLWLTDHGDLQFSAATDVAEARLALRHYLGLAPELRALLDQLPHRSDAVLAAALAASPGLILLRQPLAEALLGFICSSTKQIVQIKQICEQLATTLGDEIAPGIHALPTWIQLAAATAEQLRGCALGFRARYVQETAAFLAGHPGWLEGTEALPYAAAKARLLDLPGVGEKVADCVLLFGAGKLEAFPVDVWILKTLAARYGLTGWTPRQLAQYGRAHYGPLAGLAQQYLFAYERR